MNLNKILGYVAIIGIGYIVYSQYKKATTNENKVNLKK